MADTGDSARSELVALLPAVGTDGIDELLETGSLSRSIVAGDALELVPGEQMRETISADLQSIDFTVGVEVLHLIRQSHASYPMSRLASLLLQISTLSGLEYYSESKGRMRVLFETSTVIDDPSSRRPVADPVISGIPADGSISVLQVDTTFGENMNTIDYHVTESTIHMITTNLTTFSWGLVPIIRPGRLRSHVVIVRTGDYMLYYANFGADALRVSFFQNRIHTSFHNRLIALQGWFEAKLEE